MAPCCDGWYLERARRPVHVVSREGAAAQLLTATSDTVVFSHFVAINAVIGAAIGNDRLVIRSLDNCSVTIIDITDGRLVLVEGGEEADTLIR